MKKLTLAIMLVAVVAGSAFAQSPDAKAKADEVLKKARAAIGSESKFKSIQALSAEGTINQNQGDRRIESTLELDMLMPDKVKLSQTMQFGTIVRGFDGTNLWADFVPGVGMGGGPGGGGARFGVGGPGGPGGGNSAQATYMQQQQRREMVQILLAWFLAAPASSGMQYAYVGEAPGPEGSKLDVVDAKTSDGVSTRLYFNKETYRLVGLSYKAKNLRRAFTGGRGPGGQAGQGAPGGRGGNRPPQAQGTQGGAQPGQAQGQAQGQRPQLTQEERDRMAKERAEAFEKAPEVDYRWAFDDYKSVGGLNLPHRLTKLEAGTANEEWEISKYKINPKLTADKFEKKEKEKAAN
ncbi:MAG: hypothetical protein ABI977_37095 [Acidobacteriota bacterium]